MNVFWHLQLTIADPDPFLINLIFPLARPRTGAATRNLVGRATGFKN